MKNGPMSKKNKKNLKEKNRLGFGFLRAVKARWGRVFGLRDG